MTLAPAQVERLSGIEDPHELLQIARAWMDDDIVLARAALEQAVTLLPDPKHTSDAPYIYASLAAALRRVSDPRGATALLSGPDGRPSILESAGTSLSMSRLSATRTRWMSPSTSGAPTQAWPQDPFALNVMGAGVPLEWPATGLRAVRLSGAPIRRGTSQREEAVGHLRRAVEYHERRGEAEAAEPIRRLIPGLRLAPVAVARSPGNVTC